jgi:indolepyruvate ferredoxin oxidoreductase
MEAAVGHGGAMQIRDKFLVERGSVYLTGIQALVRLPLDQVRRDRRAGLNTAVFISGYEGSPLGGYDLALERAGSLLTEHDVRFVPGVNEELAVTAVLGSQIHHVIGDSRYDGVTGIWYGKGPGVDRSGDVFRHANLAGTGPNCAALALAGDDHIAKSSTIPHQSDFSFYNTGIPLFYPGSVQEILDYGLLAIALSRLSGAWAAMKLVTNVCDGGATVEVDPARPQIRLPENYAKHSDPRLVPPYTLRLESEMVYQRLDAAREFARLNGLDRMFGAETGARLGIATAGKSYYDLMQALADLGIRPEDLAGLGIRIAKFGMTFPVETRFAAEFARGLETLLVIEEKRSFLELQLRDILYNSRERGQIIGKHDEQGTPLVPATMELDPEQIAVVVGERILRYRPIDSVRARLRRIAEIRARTRESLPQRTAAFCPGCPHNRSTVLLPGQLAGGGIGCHAMARDLAETGRGFEFLTQMGGDGAPWIGMAPFVGRQHIFQNVGDGTYFHSGEMALRACVAAGVNITYKILYNGAVAMTGGQSVAGAIPVPELTRKLEAEGVRRTVVLTDELSKYSGVTLAANAEARDRDRLPETLVELERTPGVTVIIFDQQCAAEKRRLRSRGRLAEPLERLVIHEEVCEGCGDCVKQSNCMSLAPVMTEYGQKTRIHQSSCNKDYSCLLGDCPAFLTVRLGAGTGPPSHAAATLKSVELPAPRNRARVESRYSILAAGIGGTGVVTVNALLATAAWIEGLPVITLDQTGLSQKGGPVVSSIILSNVPLEAPARIGYAHADLILGFDLLGAAGPDILACADPARTIAVVNTAHLPTAGGVRSGEILGPGRAVDLIEAYTLRGRNVYADASRMAEALFGSHLATNVFLLGVAYQAGLIPLEIENMEEAIRLNGTEWERNVDAFRSGRHYYDDAAAVEELAGVVPTKIPEGDLVERRAADLARYQDRRYAGEYVAFVREVESAVPELAGSVARYLYKLMAYKDEYEVARLLTNPEREQQIRAEWQQADAIEYHLHPPLLRALGWKRKIRFGPWFRRPLKYLAAMKRLRGTRFDPFGYAAVRHEERALVTWYRDLISGCLDHATPENLPALQEIAALPDQIRGYEAVKLESARKARQKARALLKQLRIQHVNTS